MAGRLAQMVSLASGSGLPLTAAERELIPGCRNRVDQLAQNPDFSDRVRLASNGRALMSFENHKVDKQLLEERDVILVGSLGQQKRRSRARWGFMLVVFMRVIAAIWIVLGLAAWLRILLPGSGSLETLPTNAAAMVIFFAVGHILAAAGLWMATPWGGVLWLVMLAAEIGSLVFLPAYFSGGISMIAGFVGLALSYFLLSYYAANEHID